MTCANNSEELTVLSGNTADVVRTPISCRALIIVLSGMTGYTLDKVILLNGFINFLIVISSLFTTIF